MGRLNQKRRQRIGFVYTDQVENNVQSMIKMRKLSDVQEKNFVDDMTGTVAMGGNGLSLAGSGLSLAGSGLSLAGSGMNDIQKMVSRIRLGDENMGSRLQKSAEIMQETKDRLSEGQGLKLAGQGLKLAGQGGCCHMDTLPGEELKKKVLRKILKERKRVAGSGRVTGQSRSKTLPDMPTHKINPVPIVGAGQQGGFIIALSSLIAGLSAAAVAAAEAAALGAAGAAGALIVKKIAGEGIKEDVAKQIRKIKITAKHLPKKTLEFLKKIVKKLRSSPDAKKVLAEAAKVAGPILRDIIKEQLKKKFAGGAIKFSGSGHDLGKKFDTLVGKILVKNMQKLKRLK